MFEEVLKDTAQERQATQPLQLRQFTRQETHAGELTDASTEDGDKTEQEADVRAWMAKIDQTTIESEATPHHLVTFNATPIVITEPSKI